MKKKIVAILIMSITLAVAPVQLSTVYAESTLDSIVTDREQGQTETGQLEQIGQSENNESAVSNNSEVSELNNDSNSTVREQADNYINALESATELGEQSAAATKINSLISKAASFIIQIISYFIVAFLVVRIVIDICYIVIPFVRPILAYDYTYDKEIGVSMNKQMSAVEQGGMGLADLHGAGKSYPASYYKPKERKKQWVSYGAINAVEAASNGESAFRVYAKDMIIVLVLTPIMLTLAITGVLTDFGFLLGDVICNCIRGIANLV
jgi:hypothetical protein